MTRFPWSPLAVFVLAACAVAFAQAPSEAPVPAPPEPADEEALEAGTDADDGAFFESIDVNLVNIDVYVTDKKTGEPVTDLTRDDFEIYESGSQVAITNFYAVVEGRPTDPRITPEAEALSVGESPPLARLPEDQRLHLIVYVDNFNIEVFHRNRVFTRLREFLQDHLDEEDRVMLVSYDRSLNFRHPFTSDSVLIANALFDLEKLTGYNTHRNSEREEILEAISNADQLGEVEWRVRQFAESSYNDLEFTIGALKQLIGSLGGLEGRKALLYVSSGLPMSPGEDLFQGLHNKFKDTGVLARARDFHGGRQFGQLAALANSNRVSFYTIDAAGLRVYSSAQASRSFISATPGLDSFVDSTYIQNMQEPLRMLAERTGGKAIVNTNDVGPDLAAVGRSFDTYYSLGYTPSHSGDGRYHRLEVKVNRKGVDVRHRGGYRDKNLFTRMSEGTTSSLLYGYYDNPLDVAIKVGEQSAGAKQGQYLVPVMVEIPIQRIVLVPREDYHEARLKLFFSAMDEKGDLSDVTEVPLNIKIPNGAVEQAMSQALRHPAQLQMRRGGHRLAVGVRDEIGAVESFVIHSFMVGS